MNRKAAHCAAFFHSRSCDGRTADRLTPTRHRYTLQHVAVAARHAVAGTGVPQRNVIGGEGMNCMSDASAARGHRARHADGDCDGVYV
ncbi:hypothetical protein, partial [Xanthomonas oryzae]|uniref:hypothetical protein n=1 Tax=Xanthomonas oryzae TaxID=347 RepID=UPI001C4A0584